MRDDLKELRTDIYLEPKALPRRKLEDKSPVGGSFAAAISNVMRKAGFVQTSPEKIPVPEDKESTQKPN